MSTTADVIVVDRVTKCFAGREVVKDLTFRVRRRDLRAAGRIFRVGMLMYGKEPGVRELMRWMWRG